MIPGRVPRPTFESVVSIASAVGAARLVSCSDSGDFANQVLDVRAFVSIVAMASG